MKGSRFVKAGQITIGCMSEDARDLLDRLVEKYEETYGKDSIHDKSAYSGLYWACRWSGMIQPYDSLRSTKTEEP